MKAISKILACATVVLISFSGLAQESKPNTVPIKQSASKQEPVKGAGLQSTKSKSKVRPSKSAKKEVVPVKEIRTKE